MSRVKFGRVITAAVVILGLIWVAGPVEAGGPSGGCGVSMNRGSYTSVALALAAATAASNANPVITITGDCAEDVSISGFTSVTLQAGRKGGSLRPLSASGAGVVYVSDSTNLTVSGLRIWGGNRTATSGGGIDTNGGDVLITGGAVIEGNRAAVNTGGFGGGVHCYDATLGGATLTITGGVRITNNIADYGGGVFVDNCNLVIGPGVKIDNNFASYDGGGIFTWDAPVSITGTTTEPTLIVGNKALRNGGGMQLRSKGSGGTADLTLSGVSIIAGNFAAFVAANLSGTGGAIQTNDAGNTTSLSSWTGSTCTDPNYGPNLPNDFDANTGSACS